MRHPLLSPAIAALIASTGSPFLHGQSAQSAVRVAPLPAIAYQGRLLQSGVAAGGTFSFVFSILDSTGTEQWNSGAQNIVVTDGLYSTVLGSEGMPAISASVLGLSGLMLHITVSGQALVPDVSIVPAFQANSAWSLLGSFGGDLSGSQNQTLVMNLQGIPLDLTTTPPTIGQALVFNGSKWIASSFAGTVGSVGPQGPAGLQGTQGPAGPTGAAGATGPQGLAGLAGIAGATGPQGPAGANGGNGRTILNGLGSPVATSVAGAVGDFYLDTANNLLYGPKVGGTWVGLAGVPMVGPQGAAGVTGMTGPQGLAGLTGAAGPQGTAGAAGPQGPIGLTGATGAMGSQGLTGLTGIAGPQGTAGAAGPQGPRARSA